MCPKISDAVLVVFFKDCICQHNRTISCQNRAIFFRTKIESPMGEIVIFACVNDDSGGIRPLPVPLCQLLTTI